MEYIDRLRFFARQLGERLWVRPLALSILSILGLFAARAAGYTGLDQVIPNPTVESLETLLSLLGASMLVIATFALASMISAYASATSSATPRSFTLIIADDVSQNALSTFIGSFIFSIVSLIALKNDFFQEAGRVGLFALTVVVFVMVILTFVRWADQIARLGRVGMTIEKVEEATAAAMRQRKKAPTLRGVKAQRLLPQGEAVHAPTVGYVQRIDISTLQTWAEEARAWVAVAALPGTFAAPGRPLVYVGQDDGKMAQIDHERIVNAFVIGRERTFDEDPRFGLVALSEIADKALSPGINDPGTAIAVIGSLVRLFILWTEPAEDTPEPLFDRVEVPELSVMDMFDDAFTAISRDGAGTVEVMVRLLKALKSLSYIGGPDMHNAARIYAQLALERAEKQLDFPKDLALVRDSAKFSQVD